jgi:broad specificity phosphatase PhoE
MSKVFLVRHGEPVHKGCILGRFDSELSAAGRRAAAASMPLIEAAAAYISPLVRARQTAEYLRGEIPRIVLEDLAEVAQGEWEGKPWEEIERDYPELAKRKLANWFSAPAPGGESWAEACARAARALDRIRNGPAPAVVVAHQGINSALAFLIAGTDPLEYSQSYCKAILYELK